MPEKFVCIPLPMWDDSLFTQRGPVSKREAWADLLTQVEWEERKVQITPSYTITINPGTALVSLEKLAERWRWDYFKTRRFIKALISAKMFTQCLFVSDVKTGKIKTLQRSLQSGKVFLQGLSLCQPKRYDPRCKVASKKQPRNKMNVQTPTGLKSATSNNQCKVAGGSAQGHPPTPPHDMSGMHNSVSLDSNAEKGINNKHKKDNKEGELYRATRETARTWTKQIDVYMRDEQTAYDALIQDQAFLDELRDIYPHINVKATIAKAHAYWHTDRGWNRKKKTTKTGRPKWTDTYRNSCGLEWNQVSSTGSRYKRFGRQEVNMDDLQAQAERFLAGDNK